MQQLQMDIFIMIIIQMNYSNLDVQILLQTKKKALQQALQDALQIAMEQNGTRILLVVVMLANIVLTIVVVVHINTDI